MTTCSDCGTQYADDAPYCPNCGKPNPARQGGAPSTPAGSSPVDANSSSGATGGFGGGSNPTGGFGGGTPGSTPTGGFGGGQPGGTSGGGFGGAPETPAGGAPYGGYAGGQQGGGYAGGAGGGASGGGYGGQQGGGGYSGPGYGGGQPAGGAPQNIPNYLVQAILVTLCCCLPLGIVSIIYATQVNTKRDAGDIAGALEASKNAKKWAIIGVVAGVIWIGVIMAFNGLAFIMALANGGANS